MKKKSGLILVAVISSLMFGTQAQAHMFWLLADRDAPKVGEAVRVEVGWGHQFPRDEEIKAERLAFVKVMDSQGRELPLKKISTAHYEFVPPAAGAYLVFAQVTPDFLSRTPEGFKLQSKKDLPEAVFCFRFDMAAKTILTAEPPGDGFNRSAKSPLEIIPLDNPATLKPGQTLPVKVMFQGSRLPGAEVKIIHAGSAPQNPVAMTGKTDALGETQAKLDKPGKWLLHVSHKTPYPVPEECDEHSYSSSLTVSVR
jgi:uncharacterized GH25 family protein